MDPITLYSTPTQHECCSRKIRRSFAPFCNIEEGVTTIQKILDNDLLCLHDVGQINQIYEQIDLMERQIDQIPPIFNSQHVLEKIIEKIKMISCVKNIHKDPVKDAKYLLSLYYLKNFSDKNLPIKNYFDSLLAKIKINPETMKNTLRYLSICDSERQFNKDVKSLIDLNSIELHSRDGVTKILDQKRNNLQRYITTTQIIEVKRQELKKGRESNPKDFPAYFDELLDGGYLHLYEHIIEMRTLGSRNDRQSAIEEKTFSLLSHVVLETRQAIIEKIESSMPNNCPNVLFLLGGSGAGKSTTFCFLRGDEMVLTGFDYESTTDKDCLIGHGQATSCTFLPSVEIVNDWVIVDFPGFDDSNSPLFSLGMECALKALIARYKPKIMIIESITNTEGRFAAAAQLGLRLQRLLNKKEECILGITKYSKDPDFRQIRLIEAQQKKERLLPASEETLLTIQINTLSSLNQDILKPTIKEKQQLLEKIQREKIEKLQEPLPETNEKIKSRQNVQKREDELLKQIGLVKKISFDDLNDPTRLTSFFLDLSEGKAIHVNPKHTLDTDHSALIDHLFVNDLVNKMKTVKYDFKFKNFEQSVNEFGLIHTIFSQSNPEIGQLLHLPEIDPNIVRNYDKKIVDSCIDEYVRSVIFKLDISIIKVTLKKMKNKADTQAFSKLEENFSKLEKYVLGLQGIDLSENATTEEIEAKWEEKRNKINIAVTAVEQKYALPTWANMMLLLPTGILPLGIHTLNKWNEQKKVEEKIINQTVNDCTTELERMHSTLQRLIGLKQRIEKKEALDQAFESVQISFESRETALITMERRIEKVRLIYGIEEWDKRVAFLVDNLVDDLVSNPKGMWSYACWLMESSDAYRSENTLKQGLKVGHGKVNQAIAAAALLFSWKKNQDK